MFTSHTLTNRQLRSFGFVLAAFLAAIAFVVEWRFQATSTAIALGVSAIGLLFIYYAFPASQRPIYDSFRLLTAPIQWMLTILLLGMLFYLVVTPIGFMMRVFGKNIANCEPRDSYWVAREDDDDPASYYQTY